VDGLSARDQLHPGLSLVAYTLLAQVDATPGMRAADLAAHFFLDKSTLSRQLEQLTSAWLLRRDGERRGRRGYELTLTPAGRKLLDAAGHAVRDRLAERLTDSDGDIAAFAELVTRFNDSAGRPSGKGVASANSSAPCLAPCPTLPGS
jgi:DNA-binding MarR family transcriptional regulator